MKFSREPAVLIGLIMSILSAITEALQAANADGEFNAWVLIRVLLPLLAGIATRYLVVPVEVVRQFITSARTTTEAVNDLANKVDVAITDRPGS